ncbi:MAG: bifunctional demethylmenaquinone methyltransferase/2-methoxy-6-polyprenyl-1,4-benzoquinol methylase UbiE [Phycisphaeraceae bacterium]
MNAPTPPEPAWSEPDLVNPHAAADKASRVQRMFAAIAPSYDLNNRLHSMWRDQAWRRKAVRIANPGPADAVLDVACGTGDLTIAFARRLAALGNAGQPRPAPGQVLGIDFTYEMLPIAAAKTARAQMPAGAVRFATGDAMRLPLADASVDVVSIAFGIRNVADSAAAMREFHRVLRPGGRLIVLEFSIPASAPLKAGYMFYFKHVMPRTAALIARDRSGAYRYLPQSVSTFIDRPGMVRLYEQAGFEQIALEPLTFGIAVCYRGVKKTQESQEVQEA